MFCSAILITNQLSWNTTIEIHVHAYFKYLLSLRIAKLKNIDSK